MVLGWVAPPDIYFASEIGMELIDGSSEDGFFVPCWPEQRIDGHTAIDPAGGVAGVEGVGERGKEIFGNPGCVLDQLEHFAAVRFGKIFSRQATDESIGELAGFQAFEIAADFVN